MPGLLATKFHRPPISANWVQRPNLIQRLNEGLKLNRQVTLVSAPAGFGKTSCTSEWVNTVNLPVSWLSLDHLDDDPGRFFVYFIAALQRVNASLCREMEDILRSGQLPTAESLSTAVINDISAFNRQFIMVLDDFHVIQDTFILQVFERLFSGFPYPLHLVLVTREDPPLPLARLRANNLLTEIRAVDLRFIRQEIVSFLNDAMGLSLSPSDIGILEVKTEGWIAGLQLAGLSVRDQSNPSSIIAALSGNNRFILSYLTEQVLNHQPEEVRRFLLQTSILDRLNGDLCNAVTGRTDSHILLERMFTSNLFLAPLDDERQWYRYHHLFADLLRDQQNIFHKDSTLELHRSASRWYAGQGMASEAIHHALTAADYALAVDLLESHAMQLIMQGYAKTVSGWFGALPEEWASRSPRTNLAFAWALLLRGAYSQASEYLDRLRAILDSSPDRATNPSIRAEWQVMQSLILYMQDKLQDCMEMVERALDLVPEQDSRVRSLANYVRGSVLWRQEDYQQAVGSFQESIRHSQAAQNLMAEMMSTIGLAGMALELGHLRQAYEISSQAVNRIERLDVLHPISALIYAALGDACYQWYRIDEARHNFQRALHLSSLGGSNTITILCRVLLSRLALVDRDLDAALNEIQLAVDLLSPEAPPYVQREVAVQQVRIFLAQDRPEAAETVLQRQEVASSELPFWSSLTHGRISQALPQGGISSSDGLLYNCLFRVFLYQARAGVGSVQLETHLESLTHLISSAFKSQQRMVAFESLLLRAQMYKELGNSAASTDDWIQALELSEPEGFISIYLEGGQPVADALESLVRQNLSGNIPLEYISRILNAFTQSRLPEEPRSVPGQTTGGSPFQAFEMDSLVESLTKRELEVLHLMAEGLKYREIADRLFISLNTVRYHVKAAYSKLNVRNRTQAIELAHKLRIL